MLRLFCLSVLLVCAAPLLAAPAQSLNIVLTNDDGFETANVQALYSALRKAGHDVILSAPYAGQSGTGGMIPFLRPIGPTAEDSPGGALKKGSAGVGETGLGPQQFYVDASPAAALLYGVDIQAQRIWGQFPDLVVSGPNEGNNLGILTPHSGTLGATVTALNKGLPAIAVSADNGDAQQAAVVADLMVVLIQALNRDGRVNLPVGVGLNVNTPPIDTTRSSIADFTFQFTQLGNSSNVGLQFVEDLSKSAIAQSAGIPEDLGLPGVDVAIPASSAGYPQDSEATGEARVLKPLTVTVSPIQGTYAADQQVAKEVEVLLQALFDHGGTNRQD